MCVLWSVVCVSVRGNAACVCCRAYCGSVCGGVHRLYVRGPRYMCLWVSCDKFGSFGVEISTNYFDISENGSLGCNNGAVSLRERPKRNRLY